MMLIIRRKSRTIVAFLLFLFLQTYSAEVYALTSGPAQEEYASFEPVGTTDMVNLYTGDFTYNIPLLSVPGPNGGYPINLAYHSGIGTDQEASWVGLGWNVNVGAVNRNLRGLPDDFNGDKVKYERHMRDNVTDGVSLFLQTKERIGMEEPKPDFQASSSYTFQIYFNNYKGLGYRVNYNPQLTSRAVQLGLNLSYDPHEGIGIGASLNVGTNFKKGLNASLGVSGQYNSRQGLQNISLTGSVSSIYNRVFELKDPKTGEKYEVEKSYTPTRNTGGITFNFNQGVPATTMEMNNFMTSSNYKMGFIPGSGDESSFPELGSFQSKFPFNYTFNSSVSSVEKNGIEREINSYGYLYNNEGIAHEAALTDFSHTPFNYSREIPFIPPSNITNDVFAVTGQGVSSVFKAYHSKLGAFSPAKVVSRTIQDRTSVDLGITGPPPLNSASCNINYQLGLGGIPSNIGTATSTTGEWADGDGLLSNFDFQSNQSNNVKFQSTFFKDMGDRPAILETNSMYDAWKDDKAVRIDLDKIAGGGVKMQAFSTSDKLPVDQNAANFTEKLSNTPRTRVIQALTQKQTLEYGTTNTYKYYSPTGEEVSKNADYTPEKEDHLSEISILEPDGMRYTYGLPAYNIEQEDANFSVPKTGDEIPASTTDVPTGGYDKADGVWSKKPEFLDKKKLPSYAHSWMLTSVVSADYVDVKGDGLSPDDLGYWVDFKYQKKSNNYHWRAPYEGAIYMPGTGQDYDDKGSYSKGTKELYYLKEIRTKTHVAVFELEERKDALGASLTENGGKPSDVMPSDRMHKLSKIKLYTIEEYEKTTPVPLKVTHFGYETDSNKELCRGIPNREGNGGKLTLRKLWFTYQNSTKGSSSPYVFHYGVNENYSLKDNDCWGNYKKNGANYPYHQFPYTAQPITNKYAIPNIAYDVNYNAPWNLNRIDLPTGSSMYIEYEQKDYAYVEDKKSMQLYEIMHLGTGFPGGDIRSRTSPTNPNKGSLKNTDQYYGGDLISPDFSYRIYFPLKNAIPDATDPLYSAYTNDMEGVAEWFKDHYIGETKQLYFKAATNLLNNSETNRNNEEVDFVSGYGNLRANTPVADYGVARSSDGSTNAGSGAFDVGYVTLYAVPFQAFGVAKDHLHPIRDAAFQHLRFNRSDLVHGTKSASGTGALFSALPEIISMMSGYKYYYKLQDWCNQIYLDGFSQIRLQVPDGKKKGGGVRVKEIRIQDNWKVMTGGSNSDYKDAEYGQTYDYTIEEDGELISSGVAYEPFVGKEQNPMVTANPYQQANSLQQPNNLFMELPVMMAHYPAASVGYRKVTVKSLTAKDPQQKRMTTPITEYEFYSPKEFPIVFDKTELDKVGPEYKMIPIPGIYTEFRRYEGVSQGYSLTFNDMPGKPKSIVQKTYPNTEKGYKGTIISKQEYEYFTDEDGNISSEVDVFTEDGTYKKARLGVEVDIQVETNENKESSDNFTLDVNLVSGLITVNAPYCLPFPMLASGGVSSTSSSLKTAVVQKFIHKKGILKSTTITTQNSTIKTENLVFDALTSEPLLTQTMNEFNDPIYSYTQKAHWKYDGMAAAFKNVGTIVEANMPKVTTGAQDGLYAINETSFPFIEGDEVYIESKDTWGNWTRLKATVYTVSKATPNATTGYIGLAMMDGSIVALPSIDKITIIRSGRKNMLGAPAGAIAAKKLNYSPNINIGDESTLAFTEESDILNATAIKYRDFWPNAKNCQEADICSSTYCVDPSLYESLNGEENHETAFTKHLKFGNIEIQVDGEPVPASAVTTSGLCPSTIDMCVPTPRDYEVKIILPSTGNPLPVDYTNYTVSGVCSYKGDDILIPCSLTRNLKVDGCDWPTNLTTQGASCEFIKGYFEANFSNYAPERPHKQYECMPKGGLQSFPIIDIFGNENWSPLLPSLITYNFLWSNAPAGLTSNSGWQPPNYPFNNFSDIASRLTNHTGTFWQINAITGELCSYMTLQEAQAMDGTAKLGLRHNVSAPPPLGIVSSTNLGGCHPFYPNYINNDHSQIWYDFKYDVISQNEVTLQNIPHGVHIINNQQVNVGKVKDFDVDQLSITLPTNEIGFIQLYESCTGKLLATEAFNTTGNAIAVNIPLRGVGSHVVEIFETGNSTPKQTVTLDCTASDVIATEVPICDGDNMSYIPSASTNYYRNGTKGNWRPWTSFTYVTERDQSSASIRDKGTFKDFALFNWTGTNGRAWQRSGLATKYSADGYELETVDALGNYSAALYGYNNNLPIAVAQNARYNELLYDGFENYPKGCNAHWNGGNDIVVDYNESHTGEASCKIETNSALFFEPVPLAEINEVACADALSKQGYNRQHVLQYLQEGIETASMNIPKMMRTTTTALDDSVLEPLPTACNCLGKFTPKAGKKYTLSAWVKRKYDTYNIVSYPGVHVGVRFKDITGNQIGADVAIKPEGSMIEHWQRVSGDVVIPNNAASLEIFVFNFGNEVYLDDLRMQPFSSAMQAYVYDKTTLRNTAVLDDNNYATFYIYDERGQLEKTKKETTEGIKTINEGRQYISGTN